MAFRLVRGVDHGEAGAGGRGVGAHHGAATDGITKALSHLGFSADVFLGQFDDNKYVNDLADDLDNDILF